MVMRRLLLALVGLFWASCANAQSYGQVQWGLQLGTTTPYVGIFDGTTTIQMFHLNTIAHTWSLPTLAVDGAATIGGLLSVTGDADIGRSPLPISIVQLVADTDPLRSYCVKADGFTHPLSTVTSCNGLNTTGWSLATWQGYLGAATSLSDEVDWVGMQTWLNNNVGKSLFLPAGTYRLDHSLILPCNDDFSIIGTGRDVSILRFGADAVAAGMQCLADSNFRTFTFQNFRIDTTVDQPTATALNIVYPTTAVVTTSVTIRDIDIAGQPYQTHYWNRGINCTFCSQGLIDHVNVMGHGPPGGGWPGTGIDPLTNTKDAFLLQGQNPGVGGSTNFRITASNGYFVDKCVHIEEGSEGVGVDDNTSCVVVNWGLWAHASQIFPGPYFRNSHANAFYGGVHLDTYGQWNVTNSLFYQRTESTQNWTGVELVASTTGSIIGNKFVGTNGATTNLGVSVCNTCAQIIIANNEAISSITTPVVLGTNKDFTIFGNDWNQSLDNVLSCSDGGTPVNMTSGQANDVCSVTLGFGLWECSGTISFNPDVTTTQSILIATTNITAGNFLPTFPNAGAYSKLSTAIAAGLNQVKPTGSRNYVVARGATQTVYLKASATFAVSTETTTGYMYCKRLPD